MLWGAYFPLRTFFLSFFFLHYLYLINTLKFTSFSSTTTQRPFSARYTLFCRLSSFTAKLLICNFSTASLAHPPCKKRKEKKKTLSSFVLAQHPQPGPLPGEWVSTLFSLASLCPICIDISTPVLSPTTTTITPPTNPSRPRHRFPPRVTLLCNKRCWGALGPARAAKPAVMRLPLPRAQPPNYMLQAFSSHLIAACAHTHTHTHTHARTHAQREDVQQANHPAADSPAWQGFRVP